jgi:hypothetical protein
MNGEQGKQLSATAFGSVMHNALHNLERHRDLGLALQTFEYYWHPLNIDQICTPVEEWIMGHSYSKLLAKGRETLKRYWDLKQYDDEEVLALEFPFIVPIDGTWDEDLNKPHELAGTVDRLAVRHYKRQLQVCIDDWKTGQKPRYLRHNIQFSAYAYASTQQEFWTGWEDQTWPDGFGEDRGWELYKRFADAPRHGWWINVNGGPDWLDAGLRDERDYYRFKHSVNTYVKAVKGGIFPLNIDGSTCAFCPFRDDCPEGLQRSLDD